MRSFRQQLRQSVATVAGVFKSGGNPIKTIARSALLAVALALLAGPTAGATWQAAALSLSPESGDVGGTITADGNGWQPGHIELTLDTIAGRILAEADVDRNGSFRVGFSIPTATAGNHKVIACRDRSGTTCREEASASLVINSPAATTTTTTTTSTTTTSTTTSSTTTTSPTATTNPASTTTTEAQDQLVSPTVVPTVTTPAALAIPTTVALPGGTYVVPDAPEWPDIRATAMEVTQGIQNLANEMPLVAGRRTTVRVYVEVIGIDLWHEVNGVLEARRNGVSIGMILSNNGGITAYDDGGDRVNVDDTLNFDLPHSWTTDEVELRAVVWSFGLANLYSEPAVLNNLIWRDVVFHDGTNIVIHPVALHTHRSHDQNDVERTFWGGLLGNDFLGGLLGNDTAEGGGLEGYDAGDAVDSLNGLYRYHPVAQVEVDPYPTELFPWGHSNGTEWEFLGCYTTITAIGGVDAPDSTLHIAVADWELFFDDPAAVNLDDITSPSSVEPDYTGVVAADRVFIVESLSVNAAGTETTLTGVYPAASYFGPLPLLGSRLAVVGCAGPGVNNAQPNVLMNSLTGSYDWAPAGEFFIGMLHPLLRSDPGGLASADDAAWARFFNSYGQVWRHGGAWVVGHEIGHVTGLPHTPCGSLSGDPNHPVTAYGQCQLSAASPEGYMGYDVYHDLWPVPSPIVFTNDPDGPAEHRAFPFMSYARPGYPDPWTWCQMLDYYGVECDPTELSLGTGETVLETTGDLSLPAPPPLPDIDLDVLPIMLIAGVIDSELGLATFEPQAANSGITLERGYTATDDLWTWSGAAELPTVRATVGGELLYQTPIRPGEVNEPDQLPAFTAKVPVVAGMQVEILSPAGSVWAQESVGTTEFDALPDSFAFAEQDSDPSVVTTTTAASRPKAIFFPLLNTDLPEPAIFQLEYSPDGDRWFPIGGATSEPPTEIPGYLLSRLPGSEAGTLRLTVRDGWRIGRVAGPQIAVEQKPPVVDIIGPIPGGRYALNTSIRLEGRASDLEDGDLADALQWTSSIDGPLGSGAVIDVADLSSGEHNISARAVDSQGATGMASTFVTIDGSVVQGLMDDATIAELMAVMDSLIDGEETGSRPVPASEPSAAAAGDENNSGSGVAGWLIGLLLVALGGAGAYAAHKVRRHGGG